MIELSAETAHLAGWLCGSTGQNDIMPRSVAELPTLAAAWRAGYAEGVANPSRAPLIPDWYQP